MPFAGGTLKISAEAVIKMNTDKLIKDMTGATRLGLRDVIVATHNDAIRNARAVKFWKTGHNARSLTSEVSGMGTVQQGADAIPEKIVDDSKSEAALYSTSGYGGFGETGTVKMAARPYMKPALDKNIGKLGDAIKGHLK